MYIILYSLFASKLRLYSQLHWDYWWTVYLDAVDPVVAVWSCILWLDQCLSRLPQNLGSPYLVHTSIIGGTCQQGICNFILWEVIMSYSSRAIQFWRRHGGARWTICMYIIESGVKHHNPSYRKMYGLIFSNCDVHLLYHCWKSIYMQGRIQDFVLEGDESRRGV